MDPPLHLLDAVLAPWRTNSRVTDYLIEHIPAKLWSAAVPGVPTRTIRAIAAHLHNARCQWIRTLGQEHGIVAPAGLAVQLQGAVLTEYTVTVSSPSEPSMSRTCSPTTPCSGNRVQFPGYAPDVVTVAVGSAAIMLEVTARPSFETVYPNGRTAASAAGPER